MPRGPMRSSRETTARRLSCRKWWCESERKRAKANRARASAGARNSIQRRAVPRHRLGKRVGEASEIVLRPEISDAIRTGPAERSEGRASGGVLIGVHVRRVENSEIDVAGARNLGDPGDVAVAIEHLPIPGACLIDG